MLQINTNELSQRKKVEIDGHIYIVRRMGAGDQLSVSQYLRELDILAEKEKRTKLTEKENKRVSEIENASLEITAHCFDDQEDGSKSLALVKNLSQDEIAELFNQIFEEENGNKEDKPEAS